MFDIYVHPEQRVTFTFKGPTDKLDSLRQMFESKAFHVVQLMNLAPMSLKIISIEPSKRNDPAFYFVQAIRENTKRVDETQATITDLGVVTNSDRVIYSNPEYPPN